jgi:hypothetical protein
MNYQLVIFTVNRRVAMARYCLAKTGDFFLVSLSGLYGLKQLLGMIWG